MPYETNYECPMCGHYVIVLYSDSDVEPAKRYWCNKCDVEWDGSDVGADEED